MRCCFLVFISFQFITNFVKKNIYIFDKLKKKEEEQVSSICFNNCIVVLLIHFKFKKERFYVFYVVKFLCFNLFKCFTLYLKNTDV